MMVFKKITMVDGSTTDLHADHAEEKVIDATNLIALPAVIDPHVHFRTPGLEYKEDWRTGAKAAIAGGCTMVFDMPNTLPPTITRNLVKDKKALIDSQLQEVGIPLRYQLFFGADKYHLDELSKVKSDCIGIKIFMGCSTGNLVIDDDESLHAVFEIAAKEKMIVAVHAEDEHRLHQQKARYQNELNYAAHSAIRNIEVATCAVEKAIALSKRYDTRLYILHVSSEDEIQLIKAAKQESLSVYAETTPHHLFFDTTIYQTLRGRAVVNPPLREKYHQEALWEAIREKVIDTIGSDHAPHTIAEKEKPYGECPSGMPGIEFTLPLLFNAHQQGLLKLSDIVSLTSSRARAIFNIPDYKDWVLVDKNKVMTVQHTESKCGWTPYEGLTLKGWPVYTICQNQCFELID